MEKQPSIKAAAAPQQLSPQEWESLIDDFHSGVPSRRARWLPLPLLDLALAALPRRDFPAALKPLLLLLLLEEDPLLLLPHDLPLLLHSLRSLLLLSPDPSLPLSLKEQAILSSTAALISLLDSPPPPSAVPHLESLADTLLSVVNRPNHGPDRSARAAACESLRELERAFPGLLSDSAGHLWALAHAERTHAASSYLLLLVSIVHNVLKLDLLPSIPSFLSTAAPLVPFVVPRCVLLPPSASDRAEPSDANLRELRRVIAFLLERPQALTPVAALELASVLAGIAAELEARVPAVAALLKVQFSGLLYTYDPILCHALLTLYSRFADAFSRDDERGVALCLALVSRDAQQPLVFRLLALHWLLGLPRLRSQPTEGKESLASSVPSFYPTVFDPLALKAKKLDALACIAAGLEGERGKGEDGERREATVVKLFEDGLVCVSAFKWLPPWSTETAVAFRTLHKFLVGVAPHRNIGSDEFGLGALVESTIFQTMQNMLVNLALEHRGLVPVIAAFLDRLLGCDAHRQVGEQLLQTFDEQLLPKLEPNYQLVLYFPIFARIAESDTVPPHGLLELLVKHMIFLTKRHGPDTGLRSWSQGSKVLGICRTMVGHHHSSRVFRALSCLLTFTCQYFPDLEVRDNARIYLRMLLCIPGKKLRHILGPGKQLPGASASTHSGSFFQIPSPRAPKDLKKSAGITSYIHLKRVTPLLVTQSWSLALPSLATGIGEVSYVGSIKDIVVSSSKESEREAEVNLERISPAPEPLCVMDSKVAEIVQILRRHFASIPDYRYMPGIKICIPCTLSFESEPFIRELGTNTSALGSDEVDGLPALYATTLTFSSTSKYGSFPPCRVPFLLGEPRRKETDIVPSEGGYEEDSSFQAPVIIEMEPREPMPGLISVAIKANVENGQIISGMLQSIEVGIEDMFLRASIPPDIPEDKIAGYNLDLFNALWEACNSSENTGREIFPLSGGKGAAAISGTRSVKLLEVFSVSLIRSIEQHMAPFVVSVVGGLLVDVVKNNGIIRDVIWEDDPRDSAIPDSESSAALVPYLGNTPLQLEYNPDEADEMDPPTISKRHMGYFLVLIFLPPRFHLLLQMEVADVSTLVRIRTDHWPMLAYIDEYLESVFLT